MGRLLGVGGNYIYQIEAGKKSPSESLVKLFNVVAASPLRAGAEKQFGEAAASPRDLLRKELTKMDLTPSALAKLIGYDAGVIEALVNGNARISETMAERIAGVLPSLDVEALLSGSETPKVLGETGFVGTVGAKPSFSLPSKGPAGKTRFVPLISMAAAGTLADLAFLDEAYDGTGVLTNVPGKKVFAIEVRGDSMSPAIAPGDFAIVDAGDNPRQEQPVIVRTIHGDVLCKHYQTREGGKLVILSSVNKSYEPIEIPRSEILAIYPIKQILRSYS